MSIVPTLRIEVEGVRHAIVAALSNSNQEIASLVDEAIKNLDIAKIVKEQVVIHAPRIIHEAVQDALKNTINQVINSMDWAQDMESIRLTLRRQLVEHMKVELDGDV